MVAQLFMARTVEILDRLGLFTDDRIPSFDTWLAGKLSNLAPGIGIVVEGWARQLHDGGPRNRRHPQNTIWGYLDRVHPTLLAWSGRYDDLREVTRADVIGARDNAQGKDRETLLVVLRSLFSYAKKSGKVFANPTVHVHVPRPVGGVLQPLAQTDIDEAIEVAVKPHIRLIIALAAVHATVSPSKNPSSASTSSPALRILIEDRSSGGGLVVDTPRIWSVALAGARYRSIDAADIASNSARTAGLCRASPNTSSWWRSSPSSWVRIETARYFPHWPPDAAHTRCSTLGGFNWSSQHLDLEVLDGEKAAGCGSCAASEDAVSGQVGFPAAG